ncbi:chemotaxis protein CheW [Xylella fastidiosa subsp. morus]|jgi:twitching motility protein PilI|uniref:Pilus biogenesis protein n=6 Tax=Xylella fastidiosa TaxID=2371 RepID=Q87D40_XYLFT|nr:chemotaxis protein CheW [Xylella fastidiosa]ADN63862.1 CheW protein [Xylella fastidiosa subsp. fastidiosa GB514]ERI60344.1 pilus biogenesis protein [Xylella fastidiosa subsp. multiplex Griffin-1]KAF0572013.1 pilus biogenesis protein [Xylella fastidiosa subsp. fastidiosa Mus-1]AAF84756.1 pilus biogenesis protein [Xylella fastidiosa 9a5c]AAO28714.1 pilus biogenesis protein [Xylella fastidiosa Temecula1]
MRFPFDILDDYERRSLLHSMQLPEKPFSVDIWRGVGYRIGSRNLVSDFSEVVQIVPMPTVTLVPGAQPWLLGVGNLRGSLLPVIDLKQFLEGQRTVLREGQRVLIMRLGIDNAALVIDDLYGQRSFSLSNAIEIGDLAQGRYAHFIERVFLVDGQSWCVFSLSLLSRTPEFRQAAA